MCSSARVSGLSGWTISAVELGTRSSWLPRIAWDRGASVKSLKLRHTEEVRLHEAEKNKGQFTESK